MKPMHIAMALLSAAMFFVLAGVFMGVQLELDGTKLVVDTASDIRWQWVFIGTAVVFFFQLLRPAFQKGLKSVSGPKFILPALERESQRKLREKLLTGISHIGRDTGAVLGAPGADLLRQRDQFFIPRA